MAGALDFNNHFLNQIILHSIQEDTFLKSIRNSVDISLFEKSRERYAIIKMIYEYFDEFKCAPKENFYDVFSDYEKQMSEDMQNRCINLIGILKDINGSNAQYILQKIHDCIRHFQLEEASVEFASFIKQGKYNDAKSIILKAMKDPEGSEPVYYDYFKDNSYIHSRIQEKQYLMKSLIGGLDKLIGGFKDTWLVTFLGATKTGKSWALLEMAIAGVLQGLNVLVISLEMNKDQVDERLDQISGFMGTHHDISGNNTQTIMKQVGDKWIQTQEHIDSVFDIAKVAKNRQRIKKIGGGGLKIMAFNRGRVNYMDIDRVLDELEEREGFYTHVIVVDYLGLMKETTSGQSKKERIGENCLGLKEICGKRNILGFSAMQGNRKAMTAKVFQSHMVADDIDTIFNSDLVIALCQTMFEEKRNKMRLFIANFRHGKQHRTCGIVRDLTIGQMAIGEYDIKEDTDEEEQAPQIGQDY